MSYPSQQECTVIGGIDSCVNIKSQMNFRLNIIFFHQNLVLFNNNKTENSLLRIKYSHSFNLGDDDGKVTSLHPSPVGLLCQTHPL